MSSWGEKAALTAGLWLSSCVPHPFTKHRIHQFVYFSQLNAYTYRKVGAPRQSDHLLAALKPLKQPDKAGSVHPPRLSALAAFLSLPPPPPAHTHKDRHTHPAGCWTKKASVKYSEQATLIVGERSLETAVVGDTGGISEFVQADRFPVGTQGALDLLWSVIHSVMSVQLGSFYQPLWSRSHL